MKACCATCAGQRKRPGIPWSSGAREAMDCGHRTGPCGRSWMTTGGDDILWKRREGKSLFETR